MPSPLESLYIRRVCTDPARAPSHPYSVIVNDVEAGIFRTERAALNYANYVMRELTGMTFDPADYARWGEHDD